MLKHTLIVVFVLCICAFLNTTTQQVDLQATTDSITIIANQVGDNTCCPPGWGEPICDTQGVTNNKKRDKNGDNCLCRKVLPGNNANGNNLGGAEARNWKDNNQPCD